MDLVKENEQLKLKEKELSRRVKILESSEEEVTRKTLNSQKVGSPEKKIHLFTYLLKCSISAWMKISLHCAGVGNVERQTW